MSISLQKYSRNKIPTMAFWEKTKTEKKYCQMGLIKKSVISCAISLVAQKVIARIQFFNYFWNSLINYLDRCEKHCQTLEKLCVVSHLSINIMCNQMSQIVRLFIKKLWKTITNHLFLEWKEIRGRSQTTFTRFGFFWPPTPLRLHFLLYKGLQKVNFFDHLPPSSCKCSLWTAPYSKIFFFCF